ncbi:hypothetical protein [Agromyces bauzanensis]|uniref:hypothetical protein n=1 Tax=Agromyces bauzanensis TaxID=1308924 RepID=UPI0016632AE2|nr:hypothetical protein [Agromyces bauzanensis]
MSATTTFRSHLQCASFAATRNRRRPIMTERATEQGEFIVPDVPDVGLRVWALLTGTFLALASIGLLGFILFTDPTRGRVFPLSWLGDAQDLLNIAGSLSAVVTMALVAGRLRNAVVLSLTALSIVIVIGSALAAILRLAQVLVLVFPFVTWVPGFLALVAWGWVIAHTAWRVGRLGRGMLRFARWLALAEFLGLTLGTVGFLIPPGPAQTAVFSIAPLIVIVGAVLPVWWVLLAFRWRSSRATS